MDPSLAARAGGLFLAPFVHENIAIVSAAILADSSTVPVVTFPGWPCQLIVQPPLCRPISSAPTPATSTSGVSLARGSAW